jgi:hypothetical protein
MDGATILRVVLDTGFVMLVVAAPRLMTEVLEVAPENTVYIVAPDALGVAVGLVIAPILGRLISPGFCLWGILDLYMSAHASEY